LGQLFLKNLNLILILLNL